MSNINMSEMDVWTCWSKLSSGCALYIVPGCIRNYYTEYKIERTI